MGYKQQQQIHSPCPDITMAGIMHALGKLLTPSAVEAGDGSAFFEFSAKNLEGTEEISFDRYKGKVCLVVNVASQ